MAKRLRVLAIAVASGRIGYVLVIGGKLRDWGLSRKASRTPKLAAEKTEIWIERLNPDVVVTEAVGVSSIKGGKTKQLIAASATVAENAALLDVSVQRDSQFSNKYEEAKALGVRFPEIQAWVPKKRKLWEPEPRNTIYFEALTLAVNVIDK